MKETPRINHPSCGGCPKAGGRKLQGK